MQLKNFKYLMILSFFIFIISFGVVSASENNEVINYTNDLNLNDNFQYNEENISSGLISNDGIKEELSTDVDGVFVSTDNSSQYSNDSFGADNTSKFKYINYLNETTIIVYSYDSFEAVQYAIDMSKDGDTILLFNSFNGEGSPIIVNKSITIDGNFNSFDAKGLSRIFCVLSDNVTLKNLKLVNGFQSEPYTLFPTEDDVLNLTIPSNDSYYIDENLIRNNDSLLSGGGAAIKWIGNNGCLDGIVAFNNYFEGFNYYYDSEDKCDVFGPRVISWLGLNGTIRDSFFADNQFRVIDLYERVGAPLSVSPIIDKSFHGSYKLMGKTSFVSDKLFISDVFLNQLPNLKLNNSTMYYGSLDKFSFNLANGEHIFSNESVIVAVVGEKANYTYNISSDSNGLISFTLPKNLSMGKYTIMVYYVCDGNSTTSNSSLNIDKAPSKIVLSTYSTSYNSGKNYSVKLVNTKNNKAVSSVKIYLKVFTAKKYKTLSATTNTNGIANFDLSKFAVGSHKISISGDKNVVLSKKDSSIKISKAKTNVKLSKTSFTYKKSDALKIAITHKVSKKALAYIKIIVKICNGKKVSSYSLKTDKKGFIKINTKNLSKGSHKITIGLNSKYYIVSKTTFIKVND